MVATEAKVNLIEAKGKLKQKFASLMNDELLFEEGMKEEMYGKHQARIGQTEKKLDRIMSSLEELNRYSSLYFSTWDEPESVL